MIKDYKQFALFGKMTFIKAAIEPPFRVTAHMANEACFYYVISGNATVTTSTQRISTNTSEGLVMQCGNYLNDYLSTAEGMEYCEAIAIHLNPEVLKMIYDKEFPDFLKQVNKVKSIGYQKLKSSQVLKNYIESLLFYFDNPDLVSEELLKLKLKELILLLAKTDKAEQVRYLLTSLFSKEEINFKEIIEANLYNNLSLEELATLSNLSLSTFKREFVKHYELSPAKYIRQRKLAQAAKLLQSTTLRISDVAFDCGFGDLAHFSKIFQKTYGLSPSDFRLNEKNKSLS